MSPPRPVPPDDDPTTPTDHRRRRALLRAGDHDVFESLFADHGDAVFATALRITGSRATAEDVTSETFLVAWRRRSDVELTDTPLLGWLLAIAARQSSNAVRGRRRRLAFLSSGRTRPGVVDDFAEEAAGRVDDCRLLERVQSALQSMNRRELEVISLCLWSELSYQEAAETLGVPIGTVRSRLHRARERLRSLTTDPADLDPDPALRGHR